MAHDPVCYAAVDEQRALEHNLVCDQAGHRYFFCSENCLQRFIDEAEAFDATCPQLLVPPAPNEYPAKPWGTP